MCIFVQNSYAANIFKRNFKPLDADMKVKNNNQDVV